MFKSKIDSETVGSRLKEIRVYLGLSQQDLSDKISITQSKISKIESGKGGSLETFLSIIEYYSSFIYIHSLFEKDFVLVSSTPSEVDKSPIRSVIQELLSTAVADFENSSTQAKKKLLDAIDRVKVLLD